MFEIFGNMVQLLWEIWGWIAAPLVIFTVVYRVLAGEWPIAFWWAFRCFMGKPSCYRSYKGRTDGLWFAMCKHCHRQSEMHR